VITQGGHRLGRHEVGIPGAALEVLEGREQQVALGIRHAQTGADAAAERARIVVTPRVGQAPIACEHQGEQRARVEAGAGEQAQLVEYGRVPLLGLVDEQDWAQQSGVQMQITD